MGFLAKYATAVARPSVGPSGLQPSPTDGGQGRAIWQQVFGATDKERGGLPPAPNTNRTVAGGEASFVQLLKAMRSGAPGGWSDDRYEQWRHFVGVAYVAIHNICKQMSMAEFQVFKKDDLHPDGKRPITRHDPPDPGFLAQPYELVQLLEKPNRQDSWGKWVYRACFPPGTTVRMADGTQKKIEQIILLDEVLTAEGNVGPVNQVHVNDYEGDLVNLQLWGHNHLRLTPDHEVLTKRGYVHAGDLVKGDWVVLPRYRAPESVYLQTAPHIEGETIRTKGYVRKGCDGSSKELPSTGGTCWKNYKKVPDFLRMTANLGRIFGLFLAEGHSGENEVVWSFGTHEKDTLVAELVGLLKEEFGVEAYTQVVNEWGTVTQVVLSGVLWKRLFRSLCGSGAAHKKIHHDLLAGPDDFLAALFNGWIDGDGHDQKNGVGGSTVSRDLAMGMFDIANHLGWRPGIGKQKPSNGMIRGYLPKRRLPRWVVSVQSPTDNYRVRLEDGKMWRRVRGLSREAYSGKVFNFGVVGDNSYVAEGIGVHNCQQKLLTGSGLNWLVPNELGYPYEMYIVPTAIAIPQPVIDPQYPNGYYRIQPVYPYGPFSSYPTPYSSVGAIIPGEWMWPRFQFPHPFLRYDGYSPLSALRLHLDEVESIDRSRWYSMQKSFNPAAVLNLDPESEPLPAQEVERIKVEFENSFQGPQNSGQLFVGGPGTSLEQFGIRPAEMDYQSGWDQLVSFTMGAFGITKPAAGMIEDASYSNLFATLKQLDLITLSPECNDFGNDITRFIAPFFGDGLIVEVRTKRIDDHEVKHQKLQLLLAAKAITKNEFRHELEMPLTQEIWGNDIAGMDPMVLAPPALGQPNATPIDEPTEELEMMQEEERVAYEEGQLDELEDDRPGPDDLSRGGLGGRHDTNPNNKKWYDGLAGTKSLYDRVRAACGLGGGYDKSLYEQVRVSCGAGRVQYKSLYNRAREVCVNGHGK